MYKRDEYLLRNKLKRAAETSSERLREIFNETCQEDPLKNMISFQQIESSMCKRRRYLFQPLPKDAEDFSKLTVASPFTHLYRGIVNHDGVLTLYNLMAFLPLTVYLLSTLHNIRFISWALYPCYIRFDAKEN